MPLPLPAPDIAEITEYLASHVLLEIERGQYTAEDFQDSPEIGCIEQVAVELEARGREMPRSMRTVLAKAREAGRIMQVDRIVTPSFTES